jgi:hypothetical protein
MLPGLSDSTAKYPKAYKALIEKAADAGAKAVSYEVVFVPGAPTKDINTKWDNIEAMCGMKIRQVYKKFGSHMSCIRPSYLWTENIMHAVAEVSRANGLSVGVSDPVWKQLGDTGCCCGILPDDPVFGNWQRESATNQLLEASWGHKNEIGPEDIVPSWANDVRMSMMVNMGVGPQAAVLKKHVTWADKLRQIWNDISSERGPYRYFQGALAPTRKDLDGNMYYTYKGLKRHNRDYQSGWLV